MRRRRGRPLLRTAIVGGVAYSAGNRSAQNAQREADQSARIDELEYQQQAPPPPPPAAAAPAPGGMSADSIARLQQLAQLHEQGVLTQAEFDAEKQKILQGM